MAGAGLKSDNIKGTTAKKCSEQVSFVVTSKHLHPETYAALLTHSCRPAFTPAAATSQPDPNPPLSLVPYRRRGCPHYWSGVELPAFSHPT